MMDLPQMFGTMDTIAPYDKIEKIYWEMKKAIETNFPWRGLLRISRIGTNGVA